MQASKIISCLMAVALTACAGSGSRPSAATSEGVQRVALTPAQTQTVEQGVKQMVERQDGVKISAVSAARLPDKTGIHVCGYVSASDASGKQGPDWPFYIEMLEKEGRPVAERGQVGSDPSRLSKVNFMCRHNRS